MARVRVKRFTPTCETQSNIVPPGVYEAERRLDGMIVFKSGQNIYEVQVVDVLLHLKIRDIEILDGDLFD